MTLIEAKINTNLVIKELAINSKEKVRLMELGLIEGCNVLVKHKSLLKKTLLIIFNNSCFTFKENFAKVFTSFWG